jgi:F-type H+-transporting ATPase subunit b
MLIDWYTVGAQIVNFLILLALLKYFLFDRIVKAADRREKNIMERFEEAEKKRNAAENELAEYRRMKRELEESRDQEMKQARREAEERRESLIREARRESENLREKWRESLEREKKSFYREIRETTVRQLYRAVERALADLADENVQNKAVDLFLARFDKLGEGEPPEQNGKPPRFRTGFELPEQRKDEIRERIARRRPDLQNMAFETAPNLILGVELVAGGKKIAWSLNEYTDALERRIRETYEAETCEKRSGESKESRADESKTP